MSPGVLGGLLLSSPVFCPPAAQPLASCRAVSAVCLRSPLPLASKPCGLSVRRVPDIPDRDSPVGDELSDSGQAAQPL